MAGAAWRVGIARVRSSWRAYAAIAALLGITTGLGLLALAGARRTHSSYPRFLDEANASTMSITSPGSYDPGFHDTLASFPEVREARTYLGLDAYLLEGDRPDFGQAVEVVGTLDGRFFDQDRFTPTAGRAAGRERAAEVVVNEVAADRFGYRAGQPITLGMYSHQETERPDFFAEPGEPTRTIEVRIVGVGLFPDEVLQDDADQLPRLLVTPALTRELTDYATYGVQGLVLRRGDAEVGAFEARVDDLVPPGISSTRLTSQTRFHAQQAMQPVVLALGVFGAMTAIAGLVLTAQALAARRRAERDEDDVLRALGAADRDLIGAALALPLLVSAAGAVLALAIAAAASPLMPLGAVRPVEPDPGFSVDGLLFAAAAALIVLAPPALSLRVRRSARAAPGAAEPRLQATLAGTRPAVRIGMSHALRGDDGRYGGGWAAVAGATVAITAVVTAITFGACLARLTSSPRLYGWDWDAAVIAGKGYGNVDAERLRAALRSDPDVDRFSAAHIGADAVDGVPVPLLGMAPDSELIPPMVSGRMIRHGREIVLGAATAAALGKGVGDDVEVQSIVGGRGTETLTVSGIATLPTIGRAQAERTSLGVGAIVVPERVPGFDRDIIGERRDDLGGNLVFVRFVDGTDAAGALGRLTDVVHPTADFSGIDVVGPQRPAEIVNADAVGRVPLVLGGLLALGAAASLALAVSASIRSRRRELAVLKSIGFTTRQIASTVSWHATTTAALGVVLGVPAGAIAGRAVWTLFADKLDVISDPVLAPGRVALVAVVALVTANLAAAVPARRARRVDPAAILRSE